MPPVDRTGPTGMEGIVWRRRKSGRWAGAACDATVEGVLSHQYRYLSIPNLSNESRSKGPGGAAVRAIPRVTRDREPVSRPGLARSCGKLCVM